ncbi:MAG: Gfo/Idh/MocA family oxidoreductase [Phycisphaerales bacterium]|nr:Gfo/Idh/MocA family oxidoreductase [Phycisphaerales bacterium]
MTTTDHTMPTNAARRDFLVTAAGVAAASSLLGACAGPEAKPVVRMPKGAAAARAPLGENDPIRMGLIGTGGMGSGHLRAMMSLTEQKRANVKIVAVCDVCKPRLDSNQKACTEKQGFQVDAYRYYSDLLARDDIHGVLIASPEHWHAQMAIDAIYAGKDVYVEKPMTLRFPEALALREVVEANDKILQVGTQYMTWPLFHEARKLIAAGAIGKPTFSQTSYCRNSKNGEWLYGIDQRVKPGEMLDWEAWCGPLGLHEWDTEVYHRWRRYPTFSTGIVGDLLVHWMTPLVHALDKGWPIRVTATGGHYIDKTMGNHDQVNLTVQFEKEHTMIVAGSTCNDSGLEFMIRGHEANMYLGNSAKVVVRPQATFADDVDGMEVDCPFQGHDQDNLRLNWLHCIRTREQPLSTVHHGVKIMAIVDLATRSMWEGSAFALDPKTMRVTKL